MEKIQEVKQRFFLMRNGIVADTLRHAGSSFRVVLGLNLPQIAEIAAEVGIDNELGRRLWAERSSREGMLLAPMIIDPAAVSSDEALQMLEGSPEAEVTDIACHRLLRRVKDAAEVMERAAGSERPLTRYGAVRLALNLLRKAPARCTAIGKCAVNDPEPAVARTGRQLLAEAEFLGLL